MSKIGDLFVRLGLKKDDFSKGVKEAGEELKGFEKASKAISAVAASAWAAVAAAVVKFAKDAMSMTQRWGDQWSVAMAGVKGAYGAFIRQISSGEGWENLFANMREAARVAREVADSLDEVFERKISFSYESAEVQKEIAELQNIMRDSSKSDAERKKAAQEIIAKEEQLAAIKEDIARQEANALHAQFESQTKLNKEQTDFLVKEYNANRDIIQQARKYNEEREKYEANRKQFSRVGATQQAAQEAAALRSLNENTAENVKQVAELVRNYDKSNDELVKGLMEADVAVIQVQTDMLHAQARATATLGSLNKAGAGAGSSDTGATQAAAILKRAQDSAKTEIELLYEKYKSEKELLEQYGIDTIALTEEYFRNLSKIMEKGYDDAFKPLEDMESIEVQPIEIDWTEIDADINEWLDNFNRQAARAKDIVYDFSDAIAGGFSDACQELAAQLFGLEDMNAGAIIKALLTPLADMAIRMGEIVVAEGIAMEAAKKAFANPFTAIAAGAALIAIGAAAKAGLEAVARGGTATSATSSAAYGGGASSASAIAQNVETELTIHVEGRLSGSDIVLAGQKTVNNWSR